MIYSNTKGSKEMSKSKIAITIDRSIVVKIDHFIKRHVFTNRSRAIQEAVEEKLERMERGRLARECAKLDPKFEKALAEDGLSEELEKWPEY
jgi:Arc/MetJ-type ribon-helix-helix transcriptional regulator